MCGICTCTNIIYNTSHQPHQRSINITQYTLSYQTNPTTQKIERTQRNMLPGKSPQGKNHPQLNICHEMFT